MTSEEKAKEIKRKNNMLYYMRHKEYMKEYQRKNREHIRELQSQWRAKNRERIRATARAKYAETHKRVKRSQYDGETFLGKRVGMFLKEDANRSYLWLKEHFERQEKNETKNQMKIKILVDAMCSHDEHEMTNYPRSWFVPKPTLKAGTVLEVEAIWSNFFGTYYRCQLPDGMDGVYTVPKYDININKAKVIEK